MEESEATAVDEECERIKSIPTVIWHKIEDWGRLAGLLTPQQIDTAFNLAGLMRNHSKISEYERISGLAIIESVINHAPEILYEIDNLPEQSDEANKTKAIPITIDLIAKIVQWDKKNKILKGYEYRFMADLSEGKKVLSEKNKFIAGLKYEKVKKRGFSDRE